MALLETRGSPPSTATSRPSSASTLELERGRDARHHRRQRRRQVHVPQVHHGPAAGEPRERRARRPADRRPAGGRDRAARHLHGARGAPAFSLAQRRGEPADRRPRPRARPATGRSTRIYDLFPRWASGARPRRTALSGGAAADGGHRPRADVQPARAPVRRDQPGARPHRHPRHLRRAAADQGERAPA